MLIHNKVLYQKVRREFFNNCLWYQIDGHYFEQKGFQESLLFYIFNICELNPTNKVASMVHVILKSFIFEKPEHRRGVYKQIRYKFFQSSGATIVQSNVKNNASLHFLPTN